MLQVWPACCYSVQSGWLGLTTPEKLVQKCLPAFQHMHTQAMQVAGALMWVRGTVSRPRMFLTDVAWSFGYQGLKNIILRSSVLRLTVDVNVTIYSVPGSHSYSIQPWLQPLCQLQTSSLRILSRPWFKTKQHSIKQCKTTPNPCRSSQEKNCLSTVSLLVILRQVCCAYINVNRIEFIFFYLLNQSYFLASQLLREATKYFYFSSKTCNLV